MRQKMKPKGMAAAGLFLLLAPGLVLANSPPPDDETPCLGLVANDACVADVGDDCTCVEGTEAECPSGLAGCLFCREALGQPCYLHTAGYGGTGCASAGPSVALALGLLGLLALGLWRRRGRAA